MMTDQLTLVPVTLKDARKWVDMHHRHHKAPQGGLFAIGLARSGEFIGVAIVGRPVAGNRMNDNGWVAEVTRLAVLENTSNACSKLYGACWRAAKALGYKRLITYTLQSEPGTSLRAAGWQLVAEVAGTSWNTTLRPRIDKHPLEDKFRWERTTESTSDDK